MFCQKYLPSSFSIYNLESSEVLHSQGVILDLQCLSSVGVIFCIFIIFIIKIVYYLFLLLLFLLFIIIIFSFDIIFYH